MAQRVKPPFVMLATHIDEPAGRPITPFPNMPGKTEIDGSTSGHLPPP